MNMPENSSQLVAALRGAVGVVQMVLFKELRDSLAQRRSDLEPSFRLMLAGILTNEVFGTRNAEPKFESFRLANKGLVEQELLGLKDEIGELCTYLTDALRIQSLCDHQEGHQDTGSLQHAQKIGILEEEREIPLPSSFMTTVRELGKIHNLIVPPTPPEEEGPKTVH